MLKSLLSTFTHTQNAPEELCQRYQTNFIREHYTNYFFLVILARMALQLENVCPTFSSFSPCSFLSSVAINDRKQFHCLNIHVVLNNKTGSLFLEFNK